MAAPPSNGNLLRRPLARHPPFPSVKPYAEEALLSCRMRSVGKAIGPSLAPGLKLRTTFARAHVEPSVEGGRLPDEAVKVQERNASVVKDGMHHPAAPAEQGLHYDDDEWSGHYHHHHGGYEHDYDYRDGSFGRGDRGGSFNNGYGDHRTDRDDRSDCGCDHGDGDSYGYGDGTYGDDLRNASPSKEHLP
ncbi:unnamed protein product [Victoria cruziana]